MRRLAILRRLFTFQEKDEGIWVWVICSYKFATDVDQQMMDKYGVTFSTVSWICKQNNAQELVIQHRSLVNHEFIVIHGR